MFLFSPSVLGANLEQSKELVGCAGASVLHCRHRNTLVRLDGGEKVSTIHRLPGTDRGRNPGLLRRHPFRCVAAEREGEAKRKTRKIRTKPGAMLPGRLLLDGARRRLPATSGYSPGTPPPGQGGRDNRVAPEDGDEQ